LNLNQYGPNSVKAPSILLQPGPPFNQMIKGSNYGVFDLDSANKK